MKKILITGSSGLIGTALHQNLSREYQIVSLKRADSKTAKEQDVVWDASKGTITPEPLEGFHGVIHLAGANIAGKRWSPHYKKILFQSRVDLTQALSNALAQAQNKPTFFISMSAQGYYGNTGSELVDENHSSGDLFLSHICKHWEAATQPAIEAGIRVVMPRLGVVLSSQGGALAKMLPPFRLGLGGVLGSGNQYMSWIHIEDVLKALQFFMHQGEGIYNLVSPEPVTNRDFTKTLGNVMKRPTLFPVPAFILKSLMGQMAEELLLTSNRASAAKLQQLGYSFQYTDLTATLKDLLT